MFYNLYHLIIKRNSTYYSGGKKKLKDANFFAKDRFIKHDYCILTSSEKNNSSLHIAFNVDINFILQAGVVITSILEQNHNINFNFHIFTSEITEKHLQALEKTAYKYHCNCYVHLMNMQPFEGFHIKHPRFNRVAYIRVYMPKIMKNYCRYYAYIDADMVCVGDMHDYFKIDLNGKAVAAVPEIKSAAKLLISNLQLKSNRYLNSASMWIDTNKWEEEQITERCFELQNVDPRKFHCHDQDVLNLTLDGDWTPLPNKFNFLHSDETSNSEEVLLYHFWGRSKPWKIVLSDYDKIWRHYLNISFWDNIQNDYPPKTPDNYFIYRDAGRYLRTHSEYLKALSCYFWYVILKIKKFLI